MSTRIKRLMVSLAALGISIAALSMGPSAAQARSLCIGQCVDQCPDPGICALCGGGTYHCTSQTLCRNLEFSCL